jgi:hypothetical protein
MTNENPHTAKLWTGEEVEYDEDGRRLFVDGATLPEVKDALSSYDDVDTVYFGHGVNWAMVRELENRIHVVVEVESLEEVPADLAGRIEIILRAPSWLNAVKVRKGTSMQVTELEPKLDPTIKWHGQKVYPGDTIVMTEDD